MRFLTIFLFLLGLISLLAHILGWSLGNSFAMLFWAFPAGNAAGTAAAEIFKT